MAENEEKAKSEAALREETVLQFWADNDIFKKSLDKPSPKGEFVFYDGPPFATGLPHHGHLLGSTSKDLFGRYKTMRGYHVRRRWGWDCHGLPIESKVEQKLGFKSRKDIDTLGVAKFNETARSMVLQFVHDWKFYVERLGRWVDFDNSYKTMDNSFIESVWWALKEIHKKGKLYEGKKVLMYCPHDETPLAKAEIAMDNTYKDVTDDAVTIKFKVKNPENHNLPPNTYLLAWTTTPWTLPANSALAVGPNIEYGIVEVDGEHLISAGKGMKGADLVGIEYEPIFSVPKITEHTGKKFVVFSEEYVSAEDGTGIVHTGTIYGEEDYALIQREGLPAIQLLNSGGTFTDDAPEIIRGQYYLKANKAIIADLESRALLYKKEPYVHSYPHCHRCGTRLIYNAVSSWFIDIQSIKQKLLKENEHINWVPGHLKHGRFGNIVEGAPDWTISRNRYWASPLPIWKDDAGEVTVVGSLDELKSLTKKSGNTYYVMRHGEAENNLEHILNGDREKKYALTEKGRTEVSTAVTKLTSARVTKIIASPMLRTQETARIVAEALGLKSSDIVTDDRLIEVNFGVLEGKHLDDLNNFVSHTRKWITTAPEGGETLLQIKHRMGEALYEFESKYSNETILIVSHDKPIRMLFSAAQLEDPGHFDGVAMGTDFFLPNAGVRELPFVPLPHNADYELDYHRPYIDDIQLEKDGKLLKRIPEVVDSWVEAGAMPFAEYHYPFENKEQFEKRTPGDFISEYIAQTRTWFYYLHVLGIMLFDHRAFTNVVTTGTILAADGEKMSKSKNNFTDPLININQFGADALRYYLMSSVVMQAEDFNFKDQDLRETHNRVINILRNTKSFYSLYRDEAPAADATSTHVLDQWILLRLQEVVRTVTDELDRFDTVRATRPMKDFVEDFSTWYVRRSRDRVKSDDEVDKKRALATLRHVLREFAKVIAPVMPFIAEEIYLEVRDEKEPESVHLAEWPAASRGVVASIKEIMGMSTADAELIKDMAEVRRVVSLALEARQKANIKVRQPLQKLTVGSIQLTGKTELLQLIADEVNVKEVVVSGVEGVELDTTITDDLREEGELRDLIREIQDLRKTAGLSPKDQAVLTVPADRQAFVDKHYAALARATGLKSHEMGPILGVQKST